MSAPPVAFRPAGRRRTRMSAPPVFADKNVRTTVCEGKRMSQSAIPVSAIAPTAPERAKAVSFIHHARLISLLTLISRFLGVARESLAAKYFGAGLVASAFAVAFTIPNLFRKLFGEGALSAAFIPLYAQSVKKDQGESAAQFAIASVNLLCTILIVLTIVGEAVLWGKAMLWDMRLDRLLTVKLTA